MKKIFFLFLFLVLIFTVSETKAQCYTAPAFTLGFSLDGNLAMEDAHGSKVGASTYNYQMIWGRGATIYGKLGLGYKQNHRLSLSFTYNNMTNSNNESKIPFFSFAPTDGSIYTNYNFWTGALGYELVFYPGTRFRNYVGLAVTGTLISTGEGSYIATDNTSFRMGLMASLGYEFTLDKQRRFGLNAGVKFHLMNLINTETGPGTLNDGAGTTLLDNYWKRITMLSLNLGMNFYFGVKPCKFKKAIQ